MFIRIADVILDIGAGRATAGSRDVPLSPRPFATLRTLAARPDEVVTREELMRAVWPGTHVDPNNLSQAIAAVRRALSDTGAAGCVQTVSGRGYLLTGDREGAERLYAARRADLSLGRLEAARRKGRLTPGLFAAEPRLTPLRAAPAFGRLLADARAAQPALLSRPFNGPFKQ